MTVNYYNYKELAEKATAYGATKEDRINLFNWFECYGRDYWNGEHYTMENGVRLCPIYQGVGEPDADGGFDDYEIVDAEIRF